MVTWFDFHSDLFVFYKSPLIWLYVLLYMLGVFIQEHWFSSLIKSATTILTEIYVLLKVAFNTSSTWTSFITPLSVGLFNRKAIYKYGLCWNAYLFGVALRLKKLPWCKNVHFYVISISVGSRKEHMCQSTVTCRFSWKWKDTSNKEQRRQNKRSWYISVN
jgi:hypothetical protein